LTAATVSSHRRPRHPCPGLDAGQRRGATACGGRTARNRGTGPSRARLRDDR
jgi:hypothetical protein